MLNLFKKKRILYNLNKNSTIPVINNKENFNNKISKFVIYYPTSTKEWYNSIYAYNKESLKSLVHKDNIVNNLVKSYFNLNFLKINEKLRFRRRRIKIRHNSVNRIFVSKAEIKHNNNKISITIYTYNKHSNFILEKLKKIKFFLINKSKLSKTYNKNINSFLSLYLKSGNKVEVEKYDKDLIKSFLFNNLKKRLKSDISFLNNSKKKSKIMLYWYYNQIITLNMYKFTYHFLNFKGLGLINLLNSIYNKRVEFNIVNLKSIYLNSDIFSHSIAIKLKNRKNKLVNILKKAIHLVKLPYKDVILNSNNSISSYKDVLKFLKQRVVSGVRFEGRGRLSKRLTASKSIFKYRYKGSIKNLYSSSKSLSSTMLRGHFKSNLQYTLINSKTRNGSFGLRGWISSF